MAAYSGEPTKQSTRHWTYVVRPDVDISRVHPYTKTGRLTMLL